MRLIVDGNNLSHRIWAAKKFPFLTNKSGKETGVIFGFLNTLRSVVRDLEASSVVIVWDGRPAARKQLYPDYKSNRKKDRTPEEKQAYDSYKQQKEELKDLVTHAGISQYYHPLVEADDLITLLSKEQKCIILSEDRDFWQLVSDSVIVYQPIAKRKLTAKNFEKEVGMTPRQFLNMRILMGDSSDGISGVSGIGEITATKLIKEYHTVNNVYNLCKSKQTTCGLRVNQLTELLKSKELLVRNFLLMDLIYAGIMCDELLEDMKLYGRLDERELKKIFLKYEFFSHLKSWADFISYFRKVA